MATLNELVRSIETMQRFAQRTEQIVEVVNNSSRIRAMRLVDQALKTREALESFEKLRCFAANGLPVAPVPTHLDGPWEPSPEREGPFAESQPAREFGLLPAYRRKRQG